MEIVVVILVVVLIVVVVVNIFITSSRNRQTDGTSLRDVAGQIQAAGEAQAQSISLIQQQLDTLRQQTRETLNDNTENINKRLDATNTQFLESTARLSTAVNTQLNAINEQVVKQLNDVNKQINERLKENNEAMQRSNKMVGERLDSTASMVGKVENRLGRVEESSKKIYEVGKDIASLHEILSVPKLRGNLSELFLGDILAQILPPPNFSLQHTFKTGEKVDAVIRLGHGMVSVDAKFPLENFKRFIQTEQDDERLSMRKEFCKDVKKHVNDISKKYILPDEGTLDFALMYIPAENIYYETIIKDEKFGTEKSICEFALEKRVIPVSPNSFYAYLQAIMLGLKGLRIEETAQEIMRDVGRIQKDFMNLESEFKVLGKHIRNSGQAYDRTEKRLYKIQDKILQMDREGTEELPEDKDQLELPSEFE